MELKLKLHQRIMSVILATAGYDHEIRFWEAPSGINSRTLRCDDSQVNCLDITPNKQFLAAGCNPHIRLFEINDHANSEPVLTLVGHTASVTSIGFHREVRYLYSGSEDGMITFSLKYCCVDERINGILSRQRCLFVRKTVSTHVFFPLRLE